MPTTSAPFARQTQFVTFQNAPAGSTTQTFTFDQDVVAAVAGVTAFELSFPNFEQHYVDNLQVSTSVDVISGASVSVSVVLAFTDSDNNFDPASSFVFVTVLACFDESSRVQLVGNLGSNETVLFGGAIADGAAFISGFSATVPGSDHAVQTFEIDSVGLTVPSSGTGIQTNGSIVMHDENHNSFATTLTLSAIGETVAQPNSGLVFQAMTGTNSVSDQDADDTSTEPAAVTNCGNLTFDFSEVLTSGQTLADAAVFLQGFSFEFADGDHELCVIRGGCLANPDASFDGDLNYLYGVTSVGSTSVALSFNAAMFRYAQGLNEFHNATNPTVTLLVIGILAPQG